MSTVDEDDLFRCRKPPFPLNISNTKSSMSALSSATSAPAPAEESRILAIATDQSTIAARSILMSGGTEATADKTAKAAAEAVLQSQYAESGILSIGPKDWFVKRKIRKQAEIVGSTALVAAIDSLKGIDLDSGKIDTRTEKTSMVTSSISTGLDPFALKQNKTTRLKPRFNLKEKLLGYRQMNSSNNGDHVSRESSKKSKSTKRSKDKSEASSKIWRNVTIRIESSNESSKESSKEKSRKPLLLLASEDEGNIYTINKQNQSKDSIAEGYTANLEKLISSESQLSLGQMSGNTLGQNTANSTLQGSERGIACESGNACTGNPFEFFACFAGEKQEGGIIPEQDSNDTATSFSIKGELVDHHQALIDNRSSSLLDYDDAALTSEDSNAALSSSEDSRDDRVSFAREREIRIQETNDSRSAYDDQTDVSAESRDEIVTYSSSSSSSSSSASSSESGSLETETSFTDEAIKPHRLQKSPRRNRDVAVQKIYF